MVLVYHGNDAAHRRGRGKKSGPQRARLCSTEKKLANGLLNLDAGIDFHTLIQEATLSGSVGGDRIVVGVALQYHTIARHPMLGQVLCYTFGTPLGQLKIVCVTAHLAAIAIDVEYGLWVVFCKASHLVQDLDVMIQKLV